MVSLNFISLSPGDLGRKLFRMIADRYYFSGR
jgi:hypothetical protein